MHGNLEMLLLTSKSAIIGTRVVGLTELFAKGVVLIHFSQAEKWRKSSLMALKAMILSKIRLFYVELSISHQKWIFVWPSKHHSHLLHKKLLAILKSTIF